MESKTRSTDFFSSLWGQGGGGGGRGNEDKNMWWVGEEPLAFACTVLEGL